jgi:type II secretory pathway pseudopilin PulG
MLQTLRLKYHRSLAYTLDEMLVVLATLGLIATFTIPKVLQSTDTGINKAKFKETYSAINEAYFAKLIDGTFNPSLAGADLLEKLNVTKHCPNHALNEGCAPTSQTGYPNEANEAGVVLATGVMIYGLSDGWGAGPNAFIIDVNGLAGPNTAGQDILVLSYCGSETPCYDTWYFENGTSEPGKIGPMSSPMFSSLDYYNANKALFLSLFE